MKHSIQMKHAVYAGLVITGCSCGWEVPEGADPDDAIVTHIATMRLVVPDETLPTPQQPTPGFYRHYKGGLYTVLGIAILEASLEAAVVYVSTKDGVWWIRTVADFMANVKHGDVEQPRFVRVSP